MFLWRLEVRRHVSDVVLAFAGGVVAGTVLSFWLSLPYFTSVAWCLLAVGLLLLAMINCRTYALAVAVLAGILLGFFRTDSTLVDIKNIQRFDDQVITVSGTVFEDPDTGSDGSFAVKINNLAIGDRALSGSIYVGKLKNQDIKRGDSVTFSGKLGGGFGSFAGAMWRPSVEAVDRPVPGDLARQARDWFGSLIRQVIGEPEVDLGLGYLLGQRRSLSDHMVDILKITGLTHIVVASGYNLTVLVRFSRRTFYKLSRFAALFAALVLIVCFIMITGVSPSMLRAGLVSVLSLLAWYYGRKFHPVNLLVLVAAATLLLNPSYIMDLGWLLSFGSFVGVMIFAPLLYAYFFGKRKPNFLVQVLFETFSAQLLVLPILIYFFGQISVVSIFANMLVLPTIPITMLLTFLAGLFVLVVFPLGQLFGWLANIILGYHLNVMEHFGSLEWAMVPAELNAVGAVVCYAALIALGLYLSRVTGYKLHNANVVE
ncbi:MAG: ComEC/Rec2 family competence protein [Candidatus Nomurabacteria bacterium]|jgi:competence protein ComEC|nr:ComEC/Rec2 family competence protein [Candidatus Nomurabacteria bacterium]